MDDELKKLLDTDGTAKEPAKDPAPAPADPELKAKSEQLSNLNKAIEEAQDQLRKTRKDKQTARTEQLEEEDLPKINLDDPSAKAWDRHIRENVAPVQAADERAKDEVRGFALKVFLKDKPALAKNPEKLKEVIATYESLSAGKISERTQEGVLDYLDKAYGAVFHEELLSAARGQRIEQAEADAIFSDIAVSRGATNYPIQKDETPHLSEDDKLAISKMGMTVSEWVEMKKKYG